jgi:hypothetical protein
VSATTVVATDTVTINRLASPASQRSRDARRPLIFGTNWHWHNMPNKNLRGMVAPTVLFGEYYGGAWLRALDAVVDFIAEGTYSG